jgi:hypothetical protein
VKFIDGATDAFLGGVFGDAEDVSNRVKIVLGEESKENGFTIGGGKIVDELVQVRSNGSPVIGVRIIFHDFGSGGFAGAAALLGADEVGSDEAGVTMKPGRERIGVSDFTGVTRQRDENFLGGVFGESAVAPETADCDAEHAVDVAFDKGAEGIFVAGFGELLKKIWIDGHFTG